MAKVVSSEAQSMRRQARKAAEAAGHQWSELSKKDRKAYLALAGLGQGKGSPEAAGKHEQEGPGKQRREEAKRAAQQDGRKWRELSKEQRQEYLSRAGGKAKAT